MKLFDPSAGYARSGKSRRGGAMRDHGEKEAARIVRTGLKALGFPNSGAALAALGKSNGWKIVLAGILRAKISPGNEWIASRLAMGYLESVSRMLSAGRTDKDLAKKRDAITKILFSDEKSTQ